MDTDKNKHMYQKIQSYMKANLWKMMLLAILGALIIFAIWNWTETSTQIGRLFSVLSPFVLAVFLAYLIMPLIDLLMKGLDKLIFKGKAKKVCWVISIVLSYAILIGIVTVTIIYIVPEVGNSIREMDVQKMVESATNYFSDLQEKYPPLKNLHINEKLNDMQPTFWKFGAEKVFPMVYGFSKSIVTILINIILAVVISCYIIIDKKNLVRQLKRFVFAFTPKEKSKGVWNTIRECNHIFNGFLIGKTIDSLIIGILCFIIMSILQFPFAILISIIVGLTNMIPYFGPFIGAVPGVVIYLLTDPKLAIIFAILILLLQQFDGLYLGPKILGDLTGLKPLWVIFAITVGGAYFGILGMFLGVPIVAVLSYLLNLLIKKRLEKKKIDLP